MQRTTPTHATPESAADTAPLKRLLILTNVFYPTPTVSAVRMTQWARSLPELGWGVTALTRHKGHEADAETLAREVHPSARVQYLNDPPASGVPGRASFNHRLLLRTRAHEMVVPDLSLINWRRMRHRALEAARGERPDAVLSTSTPHAIHDLGAWLAERLGVPWIADFRDPGHIDVRYRPHGPGLLRMGAHRRFERSVYERAAAVIHLNPIHGRWARRAYPFARARCHILENGFPRELAEAADAEPPAGGPARIVSVGVIGTGEAELLARAIARLVEEGRDLAFRLVGTPPPNADALRRILGDRFVPTGQVPHADALREIAGASVLVSCLSAARARCLALGTKTVEYLATGRPVVLINPTISDRLFARREGGVFRTADPSETVLHTRLSEALENGPRPRAQVAAYRERYNWPALTARLAPILDSAVRAPST